MLVELPRVRGGIALVPMTCETPGEDLHAPGLDARGFADITGQGDSPRRQAHTRTHECIHNSRRCAISAAAHTWTSRHSNLRSPQANHPPPPRQTLADPPSPNGGHTPCAGMLRTKTSYGKIIKGGRGRRVHWIRPTDQGPKLGRTCSDHSRLSRGQSSIGPPVNELYKRVQTYNETTIPARARSPNPGRINDRHT